jgi:hypothetical protein
VAARARLWIVLAGGAGEAREAVGAVLGCRPLACVSALPDEEARAWGAELARAAGLELRLLPPLSGNAELGALALDQLAREHPGEEIAIAAGVPTVEAALAAGLGLDLDLPLPVELRPGALYAFDWPAEDQGATPPVLIGADLDWLPPWSRVQARSPYPGGPGAAGTARG